jgi:predicted acyltransferase
MFLLIGEFTGLFHFLTSPDLKSEFLNFIGRQLHHHPWHGLRFWDLIQPFFMFIVGVAIPVSVKKRLSRGQTNIDLLKHALTRALLLLFFGWALYCIDDGKISFRFQNVLAQLSFTYLLAFVIRNQKFSIQVLSTIGLLVLTEILYRGFSVPGFDQPFTPDENFGAWVDLKISGE